MSHYEVNFAMVHHHKYSLTEIENMTPWEKEIYIQMIIRHMKEEKERMEMERSGGMGGM